MSYRKKMATISTFLEENGIANPLTTEPPSHRVLQDLLRQADELMAKRPDSINNIIDSFYAPAKQLEEQFYTGDNFQRILYIDRYRRANGLDPLFNKDQPFPSRDRLTGAISHGFEMAKLSFALQKIDEAEKIQNYTHKMIDVLESTYL